MPHIKTKSLDSINGKSLELSCHLFDIETKNEKIVEYNLLIHVVYDDDLYAELRVFVNDYSRYDEPNKVIIHNSIVGSGSSTKVHEDVLTKESNYFDNSLIAIGALNEFAKTLDKKIKSSDLFPKTKDELTQLITTFME